MKEVAIQSLSPVWIALRIKRTHVADFLQVDIGKDQFVVAGVDYSWSIRASKNIGCARRLEGTQHSGLCTEGHFLALTEHTWKGRY